MGGEPKQVSVDLGGPLFADGGGSHAVVAALPLAEGYSATFRNFDLQTRKPKLMRMTVAGAESVTVPAGTFEAFKLEVTSAEGGPGATTVWVDKQTRRVVKFSATLPEMNGAVLRDELAM